MLQGINFSCGKGTQNDGIIKRNTKNRTFLRVNFITYSLDSLQKAVSLQAKTVYRHKNCL